MSVRRAKLDASSSRLNQITSALERELFALEAMKAQVVDDAAGTFLACQIEFHRFCLSALEPVQIDMPQVAEARAELNTRSVHIAASCRCVHALSAGRGPAEHSLCACADRPRSFVPPLAYTPTPPPYGSFGEAAATLPGTLLPQGVLRWPSIPSRGDATRMSFEVSHCALQRSGI